MMLTKLLDCTQFNNSLVKIESTARTYIGALTHNHNVTISSFDSTTTGGWSTERWDSIETPYRTISNLSWSLDKHTHSITITTQYSANHMPRYITLRPIVKV